MLEIYDTQGVPRDLNWLRARYGNVQVLVGAGRRFRLARIDCTHGPAVLMVHLRDEQGGMLGGQPIANAWPDMELGGNVLDLRAGGLVRRYADVACVQRSGPDGSTGFGLGSGSYTRDLQVGGPHTVWVCSPSVDSDGISGLGMLGGSEHEGPLRLTFVLQAEEAAEPPPSGGEGWQMLATELRALRASLDALARHLGAAASSS